MSESITVSALNRYTRFLIESDEVLSQVWVEGEVSGFTLHKKSGHMYFMLKDEAASVKAVMFASNAASVKFVVEDGMYVVAKCRVSLFERDGAFQLYVEDLIPKGIGSAAKKLEQLKAKLSSEGLFAPERKRPLPRFPGTVGIVTSSSSAALQDVISVIGRRNPFVKLKVFPCNVQGMLAVETMKAALELINEDCSVDVAIIARGGGSKEDLWYFNDESLVRAAATLRMPFISAVGHETDFTLIDFISDERAPTPSAAAEIAVCDAFELYSGAVSSYLSASHRLLDIVEEDSRYSAELALALKAKADKKLSDCVLQLEHHKRLCDSLNPLSVLMRGYAAVKKGGHLIYGADQLDKGDSLDIYFGKGSARCTVDSVGEDML